MKRRKRSSVHPLNVVDREADRTVAREPPQRFEEGGGDGAVIDVDLRLAEQQSSFERLPLDRRQCGGDVARAAEEVGQPRERELGFGLRGPRGKDPITPVGRRVDAGQPQRRLAYPGLARQHRDAGKAIGALSNRTIAPSSSSLPTRCRAVMNTL